MVAQEIEKRCVECGTEVPTISDTPLCSKDCQQDYADRMIQSMSDEDAWCPTCGNEFESVKSVCYHHNKKHSFEVRRQKTCNNCGSTFVPSNHENDNKYCSEECFGKGNRAELVTLTCQYCDDNFSVLPCRDNVIFCSKSCANMGENNTNWIDGRSYEDNYAKNWKSQRQVAIERDFHKCRICGMTREQHREEYGKDLEVHHKIPIATFDDLEKGNQLYNLITLCCSCHRKQEEQAIKQPR